MIIKTSAAFRNDYSEQILKLRAKVLQAEQERIEGAETLSVSEAREKLRERFGEL